MNKQPSRKLHRAFPKWMPTDLIEKCGGSVSTCFRFSDGERLVLRKRKPILPSVWTERHRVLRLSSIPGKWRHSVTPYIPDILDTAVYPGIETIIIMKSPQTSGTEAGFNILGYATDYLPGPAMIVFPDKETAKDNAQDRILPMYEDSPRLRGYLTGKSHDETSIKINLRHMAIYLGWSGSVSRLGNKPIRTLILDELDKYQDNRKEASSENLAEQRTKTWRGRRIKFKISTPTVETGAITVAFREEAHARFDWWVSCPQCGALQLMKFDNIRWSDDVENPEDVLRDKPAYYACEHCHSHWNDLDRDLAVRQGQWVERSSGQELFTHIKTHKVSKVGFHIPSWISTFVSLSEVANAFLVYEKSKKLMDLKAFMNQYKAEPWSPEYASRDEFAILALCDDRPRGIVPSPVHGEPRVAALVAGVDTQKKYFRYVIRAFGYGSNEESWLIAHGQVPTFAALDEVLWKSVYADAEGNAYTVRAAVIDAMGAPGRTKAVYTWCSNHHKRAMPYQGKQNIEGIIRYTPLTFFPDNKGAKVKIPNGIVLRRADTTFFKSDLAEKLSIVAGDPGTFWLHENTGARETIKGGNITGVLADYAKEMCAEVFNPETLVWENPKQRANHYWDCEIMAAVAAWELKLRYLRPPVAKETTAMSKANRAIVKGAQGAMSMSPAERIAKMRGRKS